MAKTQKAQIPRDPPMCRSSIWSQQARHRRLGHRAPAGRLRLRRVLQQAIRTSDGISSLRSSGPSGGSGFEGGAQEVLDRFHDWSGGAVARNRCWEVPQKGRPTSFPRLHCSGGGYLINQAPTLGYDLCVCFSRLHLIARFFSKRFLSQASPFKRSQEASWVAMEFPKLESLKEDPKVQLLNSLSFKPRRQKYVVLRLAI